jgi:acyl-CoA thioesterase I
MRFSFLASLTYAPLFAIRNAAIVLFALTAPLSAAPVTLLALGDSLTEGYGLPPEDGIVPQLQNWLAQHGTEAKVLNAGVSGDTTAGGLSRLDWSLTPDVQAVMVNLGGNDMLRGLDPALSRANLDAILAGIAAKHLPVLLVSLRAPSNYGSGYQSKFDAMFAELAQAHGALLATPYFDPLMTPQGLLDPALMQADGIHPNAKGVQALLPVLGPQVQALLAKVKQ